MAVEIDRILLCESCDSLGTLAVEFMSLLAERPMVTVYHDNTLCALASAPVRLNNTPVREGPVEFPQRAGFHPCQRIAVAVSIVHIHALEVSGHRRQVVVELGRDYRGFVKNVPPQAYAALVQPLVIRGQAQ